MISNCSEAQLLPQDIRISASVLAADFSRLGDQVRLIEDAGCDEIHFDVMDGHFVPNITFGADVLASIRNLTDLPIDAHMMVTEPGRFAPQFAAAGASTFTVHAEACSDLAGTLTDVSESGMKPGISINPSTEAEAVTRYTSVVQRFLIMSVEPGFGGQSLMPETLSKIEVLRSAGRGQDLDIAVDGGVKVDNAASVIAAGADTLISGTGLMRYADGPAGAVRAIRAL